MRGQNKRQQTYNFNAEWVSSTSKVNVFVYCAVVVLQCRRNIMLSVISRLITAPLMLTIHSNLSFEKRK
jgi:hypothetical protein